MGVKELTPGEREDRQEETELRDTTCKQMLIKYEIKSIDHKSFINQVPTQLYGNNCHKSETIH